MKDLQAGIQSAQGKCIQLDQHPRFQKRAKPEESQALLQEVSQAKPRLSPPAKSSLEALRKRTHEGLQRLQNQAERINQLSAEVETAVLELKALAQEVNRDWRLMQATQEPSTELRGKQNAIASVVSNICEYQATHVPNVRQKRSGGFILTSRRVDLFKAEREATLLAQSLRRRAKRKKFKS
jgi:uncharacterized phage infection (PIP) family protein YhgE